MILQTINGKINIMVDTVSKEKRSEIMSKVKGRNTKPELFVRKLLHTLGFKRYTLHPKDLPGIPDIVFMSKKKAIFINGCFWHHHSKCKSATIPKSNIEFWTKKIQNNAKRDKENKLKLTHLSFKQLVIWECELKNQSKVIKKLEKFLEVNER